MRRPFTIPVLLVTGALAVAGCGSSNSSSGGSSSGGGATTAPAPATSGGSSSTSGSSSSGGTVQVAMKNIVFAPATVTVKVGQKITWTNDDSVPHNVTSQSGEKIASSTFGKGGTFSFTPTKAGTIAYVCTIHPGMDGTIVVTK